MIDGAILGVWAYLKRIWNCRYFWVSLVRSDLRIRYRRSLLGIGWSLVHPIAMTAVLCAVFHKIFKVDVREFAPFLMTGLAFWSYFVTATMQGCSSFFAGEAYIRQHPAPMAIYPLRATLGAGFHFLLALGVVLLLTAAAKGFPNPIVLVSLVPTVGLLFCLGWAVATLGAMTTVHFPDTPHLTEVGLQICFYATPIMYPPSTLEHNGLAWFVHYNPLVVFLTLLRVPLLEGRLPSAESYLTACLIVTLLTGAAALALARKERRLIYYL